MGRFENFGDLLESDPIPPMRRVGVPVQERVLTDAFVRRLDGVVKPGPGRSVYVLEEAELGAGRPDIITLTIAPASLEWFRRTGLRIGSPAAARALDLRLSEDQLGVSRSHALSIRKELQAQGWFDLDLRRVDEIVHESLAVEAKVRDWRSGVRQVSKFRRYFHRSAVLMPKRVMPEESERAMGFYGCGLLFQDGKNFKWERDAIAATPPAWAGAWLLELLLRGLESGSAYKLTAWRNESNDCR